MAPELV